MMLLKEIAYAVAVGGALLTSASHAAQNPLAAGSDALGYEIRTLDRADSVFPDQTTSSDYGIRVAA